jgi:diaminopimelate decarboxylase
VRHAIEHGWGPEEISFTGTNVSDRDLDVIVASGVHVNVDLCSQLERLGRRASGSGVGLRVNPRAGASYAGGGSKYAGERASKFGLFAEQLPDALAIAARHDLTIDTVHVHVGDGFLTPGLDHVDVAIGRVAAMARTLVDAGCPIREVNTGGGLGVPHQAGDEPLDLARWASILAGHLAPLGVSVATEPGDFLVKEAGVLLAEVITVEDRDGDRFVGLDAGWHQACEHFIYGDRLEVVAVAATDAEPAMRTNVTGNINEGDDLFAESRPMPEVAEGDVVAVLPVGAYGASMASHHCMRPPASSVAFADREAPA